MRNHEDAAVMHTDAFCSSVSSMCSCISEELRASLYRALTHGSSTVGRAEVALDRCGPGNSQGPSTHPDVQGGYLPVHRGRPQRTGTEPGGQQESPRLPVASHRQLQSGSWKSSSDSSDYKVTMFCKQVIDFRVDEMQIMFWRKLLSDLL